MMLCGGCGEYVGKLCTCLDQPCPSCAAPVSERCHALTTGRPAARPHGARLQLAHPQWYAQQSTSAGL